MGHKHRMIEFGGVKLERRILLRAIYNNHLSCPVGGWLVSDTQPPDTCPNGVGKGTAHGKFFTTETTVNEPHSDYKLFSTEPAFGTSVHQLPDSTQRVGW